MQLIACMDSCVFFLKKNSIDVYFYMAYSKKIYDTYYIIHAFYTLGNCMQYNFLQTAFFRSAITKKKNQPKCVNC